MFGTYQGIHTKRATSSVLNGQKLIGYVLYPRNSNATEEGSLRLEDKCLNAGYKLAVSEHDSGNNTNLLRPGLWNTLRKLVCTKCDPKRMPLSIMNFDDFVHQALSPCHCGAPQGMDGLILTKMDHLTADKTKASTFALKLAGMNKHFVAEDGICLSCCHPATKDLLEKSSKDMVNRAGC